MKDMFEIYWEYSGFDYTFKFYLHDTLIVSSGSHEKVKLGNKRKSGEKIGEACIFMSSCIISLTKNLYRKPDLKLWNEYLKSFWISRSSLLRWMNRIIDGKNYIGNNAVTNIFIESLKEVRDRL